MAKKGQKFKSYTKEFKMKVIFEKVHEEKSYLYLANKYGVPEGTINTWVHQYRKNNNEVITKNRGRQKDEEIDYKERYEILKKFQDYLKEVDRKKK
ncbi:MAG: transposase [Acholeplasmataceae bacterium]|jgi:transposase-like protein